MHSIKSTFSKFCIASIALTLTFGAFAQQSGGKNMQRPERPEFSSLDLDGDGAVTFTEFEQSDVPNSDHATIFGHIDADGDGEISEEEFTSHKPPRRN